MKKSVDPTHTLTLRKTYMGQMNKRLIKIKGLIRKSIVQNDCFGLKKDVRPKFNAVIPKRAFKFDTSQNKINNFMKWLNNQIDVIVLEDINTTKGVWQNVYIDTAYKKGIRDAQQRGGKPIDERAINIAFNQPIHADSVGIIYSRAYEGLKGITQAMSSQISSILANGLITGTDPLTLARQINGRVDKIGITRARTLARTETINAYTQSSLNTFETMGIEEVGLSVEYATAGDDRVSTICQSREGNVYSIEDARGIIPAHPNCRCTWIPTKKEAKKGVKKTQKDPKGVRSPKKIQKTKKSTEKAQETTGLVAPTKKEDTIISNPSGDIPLEKTKSGLYKIVQTDEMKAQDNVFKKIITKKTRNKENINADIDDMYKSRMLYHKEIDKQLKKISKEKDIGSIKRKLMAKNKKIDDARTLKGHWDDDASHKVRRKFISMMGEADAMADDILKELNGLPVKKTIFDIKKNIKKINGVELDMNDANAVQEYIVNINVVRDKEIAKLTEEKAKYYKILQDDHTIIKSDWLDKYDARITEIESIIEDLEDAKFGTQKEIRKLLIIDERNKMVKFDTTSLDEEGVIKSVMARNWYESMLDSKVSKFMDRDLEIRNYGLEVGKISKAKIEYFNGRPYNLNYKVHVEKVTSVNIHVHEYAHNFDESPFMHERALKYRKSRTVGEKPIKMSKLHPKSNYDDSEVTFRDKFKSSYTGKQYRHNEVEWGSEVYAMGFQTMYESPLRFAHEDPEFFKFIYETMRGLF